jgi:hypothetical protein
MEDKTIFNKSYETITVDFECRSVTYNNVHISLHYNSLIITDNIRKETIFHDIPKIKKIKT